jgi:hypothetical protein
VQYFAVAAGRQQSRRKQRRPIQGNSTSDRIPRGPGCHRHSRVCADASVAAGLLRCFIPTAIGMRFRRHDGIYQSDVRLFSTANPSWTPPPVNVQTRARERAGRNTLSPIVLMSSGRLFLDRVGRHQSPSPLRRRIQSNFIATCSATNYHRTVTSVLTVCVTPGGKPTGRARTQRSLPDVRDSTEPLATLTWTTIRFSKHWATNRLSRQQRVHRDRRWRC